MEEWDPVARVRSLLVETFDQVLKRFFFSPLLLDDLPDELILTIIRKMPPKNRITFSMVSRRMNRLEQLKSAWTDQDSLLVSIVSRSPQFCPALCDFMFTRKPLHLFELDFCMCSPKRRDLAVNPYACNTFRIHTKLRFENTQDRWIFKNVWLRQLTRMKVRNLAFQSVAKPLLESLLVEEHFSSVVKLLIVAKPPIRDMSLYCRPIMASKDSLRELRLDFTQGETILVTEIFGAVASAKNLEQLEFVNRTGIAILPRITMKRQFLGMLSQLKHLRRLYFILAPGGSGTHRVMDAWYFERILDMCPSLEVLCCSGDGTIQSKELSPIGRWKNDKLRHLCIIAETGSRPTLAPLLRRLPKLQKLRSNFNWPSNFGPTAQTPFIEEMSLLYDRDFVFEVGVVWPRLFLEKLYMKCDRATFELLSMKFEGEHTIFEVRYGRLRMIINPIHMSPKGDCFPNHDGGKQLRFLYPEF